MTDTTLHTDAAKTSEKTSRSSDRLNGMIAVSVAIISAFLAVSTIKSANISQAIGRAQSDAVSRWNQYQAKRLRQFQLEIKIDELKVAGTNQLVMPTEAREIITRWQEENTRYKAELKETFDLARSYEARRDELAARDDQFDVSEAFLALSLAMLAVSALAKKTWLFGLGLCAGLIGIVFGVAAFLGLGGIQPAWLVALLDP